MVSELILVPNDDTVMALAYSTSNGGTGCDSRSSITTEVCVK